MVDGYTYFVDMDLSKFFDGVNHDRLMSRLATRVKDKRVLKLIRKYLRSGVMIEGTAIHAEEGTPQALCLHCCPISSLMNWTRS
jgi:retron-type reverse transcriptase